MLGGYCAVVEQFLWRRGWPLSSGQRFFPRILLWVRSIYRKESAFFWKGSLRRTSFLGDGDWKVFRTLIIYTPQCLVTARNGQAADSFSESLSQIYNSEELLVAGAIPNATIVSRSGLPFIHFRYHYIGRPKCIGLRIRIGSEPRAKKKKITSPQWPVYWAEMWTFPRPQQRYVEI